MKEQFFNNESNAFTHQPLVSHEYNFLYQPIPKCACRTIKTWMILLHKKSDILQQTLSEYGNDIPTGLMYDQFNDKLSKKDMNDVKAIEESGATYERVGDGLKKDYWGDKI